MDSSSSSSERQIHWRKILNHYSKPDLRHSFWQIANTLIPYFLLWYLMYLSLEVSYLLTLLLAIPAAGFMVRVFIIFHDCGHGSFFKSQKANDVVGIVTGLLTFTPYYQWKHDHAIHHASAGNLDRRGVGDVLTLTVTEYRELSWRRKFSYRVMRSPMIMFTIGSFFVFTIGHRFSRKSSGPGERRNVVWTNLALAAIISGLCILMGWKEYLLIQLPILFLATSAGVWLFYVQHNFEGTYWERQDKWNFLKAGLNGSSFYKLPGILRWFSGNIGYHHIHHLSPRIPNYKLRKCHEENLIFQVKPLTLLSSLRSLHFRFWDEEARQMVGYEVLKRSQKDLPGMVA